MISKSMEISRRLATKEMVHEKILKWAGKGESLMRTRNLIHYEASNRQESSELIVQGIRIGDVGISTLPGEVFVAIGQGIKQESPFTKSMVVENCNKYCGYIPSKKAFDECSDLYETALCFHSCLVPEAGEILQEEAVKIMKELAKSVEM